MSAANESIRWTTLFSGMVQGVGFRYTAERLARRFAVTGFARNTRDGRVELVAEGAPEELERLVSDIEQTMSGYIRDRKVVESPSTNEFRGFSIRF